MYVVVVVILVLSVSLLPVNQIPTLGDDNNKVSLNFLFLSTLGGASNQGFESAGKKNWDFVK